MDDTRGLEKDSHGNIIVRPVTGWTIGTAFDMGILAAIQYVENPEQLKTGKGKSIQLALTPAQALDLAETLKRKATAILNSSPTPKPS